jgi:3-oxoacyl-[acyl-carrier protein] reductase
MLPRRSKIIRYPLATVVTMLSAVHASLRIHYFLKTQTNCISANEETPLTIEGSPELVIVTGAGRGIGKSIALEFGNQNATVLCISRSGKSIEVADEIREKGGNAEAMQLDLADFQEAGKQVSAWLADRNYKRIGVVLAAGSLGPSGSLATTSLAEWDETFRSNVLGNLAVAQAALSSMLENKFGRLVFFAGGGAAYAYPTFPAYAASKTALVRAVENLHEDLKDAGDFAVAILAPGAVDTDILAAVRAHGGYVRTTVSMAEPVGFAREFVNARTVGFSGSFVHVRDEWASYLNNDNQPEKKDLWKLRRIE